VIESGRAVVAGLAVTVPFAAGLAVTVPFAAGRVPAPFVTGCVPAPFVTGCVPAPFVTACAAPRPAGLTALPARRPTRHPPLARCAGP
jgi:hypothetical protein